MLKEVSHEGDTGALPRDPRGFPHSACAQTVKRGYDMLQRDVEQSKGLGVEVGALLIGAADGDRR